MVDDDDAPEVDELGEAVLAAGGITSTRGPVAVRVPLPDEGLDGEEGVEPEAVPSFPPLSATDAAVCYYVYLSLCAFRGFSRVHLVSI